MTKPVEQPLPSSTADVDEELEDVLLQCLVAYTQLPSMSTLSRDMLTSGLSIPTSTFSSLDLFEPVQQRVEQLVTQRSGTEPNPSGSAASVCQSESGSLPHPRSSQESGAPACENTYHWSPYGRPLIDITVPARHISDLSLADTRQESPRSRAANKAAGAWFAALTACSNVSTITCRSMFAAVVDAQADCGSRLRSRLGLRRRALWTSFAEMNHETR